VLLPPGNGFKFSLGGAIMHVRTFYRAEDLAGSLWFRDSDPTQELMLRNSKRPADEGAALIITKDTLITGTTNDPGVALIAEIIGQTAARQTSEVTVHA